MHRRTVLSIAAMLAVAWLVTVCPNPVLAAPAAPSMTNPNMECDQGAVPATPYPGTKPLGWTLQVLDGSRPYLDSNLRRNTAGDCESTAIVEKIEGKDSWAIESQDIETTDQPGKPFDAVLYQTVSVVPGKPYSLSAWMIGFCGGTYQPNDCPSGYYIAKMLGLDPTGGTDPLGSTVIWTEDRHNFVENGQFWGWINMRLGATAETVEMTVFLRIKSPFQHHGNFALIDAISLMEAPTAHFVDLPTEVAAYQATLHWAGALSADVDAIPDGKHALYYDLQYRQASEPNWQDWLEHESADSAQFSVPSPSRNVVYHFRVRALAEQPDGSNGAWPNHRYLGDWTESGPITFLGPPNSAPIVDAGQIRLSAAGEKVSSYLSATDPDGDPITYSATDLPPGLSLEAASGRVNGTLPPDQTGTWTVNVSASDGHLADTGTLTWYVLDHVWRSALPLTLHP